MTFDTKVIFSYISCDVFFFLIIYVCQLSQKNSLFLCKKKFSRFINTRSTNNNVIRPVNRLQARVHSCSMYSIRISASHPTHRGHQFFFYFFPDDRGELIQSRCARNNTGETAQLKPSDGSIPWLPSALRKDA